MMKDFNLKRFRGPCQSVKHCLSLYRDLIKATPQYKEKRSIKKYRKCTKAIDNPFKVKEKIRLEVSSDFGVLGFQV